jgi:ubiquinone biosynthesis O-methyltransferase
MNFKKKKKSLARLGGEITGCDKSNNSINISKNHLSTQKDIMNKINYLNTTIGNIFKKIKKTEELNQEYNEYFDIICCLEVIEHVENIDFFINSLTKRLKNNGIIFISTINRNILSYLGTFFQFINIRNNSFGGRYFELGTEKYTFME